MTTRHGVVDTAAGLVPFGHLGWGYRAKSDFLTGAAQYIADGLAQHQWIQYVGPASAEALRAELDTLPVDTSEVTVTPATEFYGVDDLRDVVDPDTALDLRADTLDAALAAGYSGVRIVADPSAVNARPEQRDAFARLEFLIDQRMADTPITALCAYDISRLGDAAGELICLHPIVSRQAPSFRVYAAQGAAFALGGDVDPACAEAFATTLQRIWAVAGEQSVIVDISGVTFISHRELLTIDDLARRDERQVVMRGSSPIVSRLVPLLELTNVRLEGSPCGHRTVPER